jgi:predicted ATPase/DNA-binding CsgD family transcriptional regulator
MTNYEAAKEGHARVVLLKGEPGIGKTRLLDEVALRTAQEGAIVLRGRAFDAEGMPPFLPFLEALGRYIRETPQDQLRTQVAAVPQLLASLLPELAVYLPDLHAPLPLPPEQARLRLFEAIGTFLEAISASRALVLILDDLHWADTASLALLCYLARYQSNTQLLLLGTYREGEAERISALASTLAELSRQRILTTIVVSPLSVVEIGMLAMGRYGGSLSPEVNAILYTQSEGNPFFAEELLDGWIESGSLNREHHQWVAVTSLAHTLPSTILGAVQQRFARLAPAIIDHLRIAAIIGRSFDLSLLATIEGQEIEEIEECLLEAVRARLIQTNQQGRYIFSHDKIRECLYIEVSTSRRRRLHEIIGHALEAQTGEEQTMSMFQLADLAYHFARSGDRSRGVHYSLLAARQALQTAAAEEAMSHYLSALDLLGPDDRRRGDVLLDLGETALLAGQAQEAETTYQAARHWFLQLNEQGNDMLVAKAAHGLGLSLWHQEKPQEARAALEHALACLGNDQCVEKVRILADLSQLLMVYIGQRDEGMAYAHQALKTAQNLGETELETMVRRIIVGNLSFQGSDLPTAQQSLEHLLELTEERGDLVEAGECCLNLAIVYFWMAKIRQSYQVCLHRITLIERCRQPYRLRTAYTWLILLLASQGKWTEADYEIERARPLIEHGRNLKPNAFLHQFQGFLAYQREDYDVAERELEAAQIGQNLQFGLGEMMIYPGLLALVQATMGRRREALASIVRLEHILRSLPDGTLSRVPMWMCLALTTMSLDDYERAKSFYKPLLAFRGQHYWFLVDRILGLLAMLSCEWETAAMHLAAAEATAQHEGLQPELARTLMGQAEVALGQGGQESIPCAIRLLNDALVLFENLGMRDSANRVLRRLQSLSQHPRGAAHPALPANLTRREADVLRLVTCGKSNSQIAQELVISEKTVINHLTHIFNKTDCENRVAATAFAIRHNLA